MGIFLVEQVPGILYRTLRYMLYKKENRGQLNRIIDVNSIFPFYLKFVAGAFFMAGKQKIRPFNMLWAGA